VAAVGRAGVLALVLAVQALVSGCATRVGGPAEDGDAIIAPLGGRLGDPVRGRALIVARGSANCVLCHAIPDPALAFAGDVGPSLAGVGSRLSPAQLRLRVVDMRTVAPGTPMPSYHRVDRLVDVAPALRGRPLLDAGEIEDIVAYLSTLR